MKSAVVIDAVRTPVGRASAEQGYFRDVRAEDLSAHVIRALVERTGIDPHLIEDRSSTPVRSHDPNPYANKRQGSSLSFGRSVSRCRSGRFINARSACPADTLSEHPEYPSFSKLSNLARPSKPYHYPTAGCGGEHASETRSNMAISDSARGAASQARGIYSDCLASACAG